jgi:hypothetical protein
MISYETNLNAAAVERLSEITDQCEGGILGSLIAAACSGVAALLLGGFYAALGIKPLHYAAIAVSLVALGLTLQSLWILLASIHKVKSLMGGSYWRLPDGVTATFITVDFLARQAIFETVSPHKGNEHRFTLNERRRASKTAQSDMRIRKSN